MFTFDISELYPSRSLPNSHFNLKLYTKSKLSLLVVMISKNDNIVLAIQCTLYRYGRPVLECSVVTSDQVMFDDVKQSDYILLLSIVYKHVFTYYTSVKTTLTSQKVISIYFSYLSVVCVRYFIHHPDNYVYDG